MIFFFRQTLLVITTACMLNGCLVIEDLIKEVEQNSGLLAPSNDDTAQAIKLALQKGIDQSISTLGATNGFYSNDKVRINMPSELAQVDRLLRNIGQQKYADSFVKTLNSAAEKAIPEAREVFASALKQMSIQDAIGIMRGGDNSATEFFRQKTSNTIIQRFRPIVNKATSSVGVTQSYKELTQKLALVGVKPKVNDLDTYIANKAMQGLFVYVAEKEAEIRADPLGQSASLIRQVFGYYKE